MRRFAQIVFPPWVRTYPKSTSAKFFVPARTKIAVKLFKVYANFQPMTPVHKKRAVLIHEIVLQVYPLICLLKMKNSF